MKKIYSILLSNLLLVGALSACTNKSDAGKTTLRISAFNGGYGLNWLDALSEAYEADHPDVKIKYSKTIVDRSNQATALQSGVADDDLYITGSVYELLNSRLVDLVDLSDLYDSNKNVGKNIISSVKDALNNKGKYYAIPWATGSLGILYHDSIFKNNNIEIPNTTNELLKVCDQILKNVNNVYPFNYSAKEELGQCYVDYCFNPWFAQYEGKESYAKYWTAKNDQGAYDPSVVVNRQGILRTLEVYEKILNPKNNYNHPDSKENTFTEAQFSFLEGQSAMMINGDWIIQEMEKSGNYSKEETQDIMFMDMPVLSAIVEKLSFYADGSTDLFDLEASKQDKYDKALSAIVRYVDKKDATKPTNVEGLAITDNDIEMVRQARGIVPTMSTGHMMVIPTNSKHIDVAKDFMNFMYSERGIELYATNVYGTGLPVTYTNDNIKNVINNSNLLKSAYKMLENENVYFTFYSSGFDPIFSKNGLSPTYRFDGKSFLERFSSTNATTFESAKQFYQTSQTNIINGWDQTFLNGLD